MIFFSNNRMNDLFVMGFSCVDDVEKKEIEAPLTDEARDWRREGGVMDVVFQGGVEMDSDFWPIEHPMEPPDEDHPVKCPMPDSSSVMDDGEMHEKLFPENLRKRAEVSASVDKGFVEVAIEPPVRVVRRRHHTLSGSGDRVTAPLMGMPPPAAVPPVTPQNFTIFQFLQQLDDFES